MRNKFKPNDIVSYLPKGRNNGTVLHIICGNCAFCQAKQFDQCAADEKNKVIVSWETDDPLKPQSKRRYSHSDLEWTNIAAPITGPRKTINGIKPFKAFMVDLRMLGNLTPEIVSIDTEEPEPITEPAPVPIPLSHNSYEDDEYYEWAIHHKR